MTYQPGVTVMAQGRKRVELGRTAFIYDPSRFLLTSIDLPVVSRMIEASEAVPCLALSLKLDMPVVRELLSREEIQCPDAPPDSPGMATGETTVEFLDACCRLVDLLQTPAGHSLSRRPDPTRDHLPHPARPGGSAPPRHRHSGRAEPPHGKSRSPGSERTTPSRSAWKTSPKSRAWACPRCTIISACLTAMSPLQYQKQLRLQAARARMLVDGLDAASAAFEVGYESASQFNREYSRFFGQPPMRDIRTLRSPDAPPLESVSA